MNPQIEKWNEAEIAYSVVVLIPKRWWKISNWIFLHQFMRHYKIWFIPIGER